MYLFVLTETPFFEWSLCNLLITFEFKVPLFVIVHHNIEGILLYYRVYCCKVRKLYLCYPSKLLQTIGCILIIQCIGFSAMPPNQKLLLGHAALICRQSFTHPWTGFKLKSICYKIHRVEERSADLFFFFCLCNSTPAGWKEHHCYTDQLPLVRVVHLYFCVDVFVCIIPQAAFYNL